MARRSPFARALLFLSALLFAYATNTGIGKKREMPEPSHIALAKRKAAAGQKAGIHGFDKVDQEREEKDKANPHVALIDIFQIVMSQGRQEEKIRLLDRDNFWSKNFNGKMEDSAFEHVNDLAYGSAYRRAFRKVIKPDSVVLVMDINTGLLPMMAAMFGAAHVYALEENEVLAHLANQTIKDNQLDTKITVINKAIDGCTAEDIPHKVDLLVVGMLKHTLIASLMPYRIKVGMDSFLKEGGKVIPASGTMYQQAIEAAENRVGVRVLGPVAGFDFSRLNNLSPATATGRTRLRTVNFRALSHTAINFQANFTDPTFYNQTLPQFFNLELEIVSSGILDSVVFFWDVMLDDEIRLSTNPVNGANHDHIGQVQFNLIPRHVKIGDRLTMLVALLYGHMQADITKINGEPVPIPYKATSSIAI